MFYRAIVLRFLVTKSELKDAAKSAHEISIKKLFVAGLEIILYFIW